MDDEAELRGLVRFFEGAESLAPKRAGKALGNGADKIRDEARNNVAQNLSPRFRRGIISRRERSGPPAAYVLVTGEKLGPPINAWEVGTAKHGPKPSIAPAVEKHADGIAEDLAKMVEQQL